MSEVLRVGTRGSQLALTQADAVAEALAARHPGLAIERVIVRTVGDRVQDTPLSRIGGKGLFTKELETALENGSIDLAVHSLKDLPTEVPERLRIASVLAREDPRDVLVSASGRGLGELPRGARVGTSSLRRRAQLLAFRPDLRVEDLRGNVPTRLEKVGTGAFDAVVVARAGVVRLGMTERISEVLPPETMLPAVGQGALAVEIRAEDARLAALLAPLDHEPTRIATTAERALLARLEGGCQVPIGALAVFEDGAPDEAPPTSGGEAEARSSPDSNRAGGGGTHPGRVLVLRSIVADLDGRTVVRAALSASFPETPPLGASSGDRAEALGLRCAERLIEAGAGAILERIIALARQGRLPAAGAGEDGP